MSSETTSQRQEPTQESDKQKEAQEAIETEKDENRIQQTPIKEQANRNGQHIYQSKSQQQLKTISFENNFTQRELSQKSIQLPQFSTNDLMRQSYIYNSPYLSYSKQSSPLLSLNGKKRSRCESVCTNSVYQAKQNHKNTAIKLQVLTSRVNKLLKEDDFLAKKAESAQQKANQIYEMKRREELKVEQLLIFREEAHRKKIEGDNMQNTYAISMIHMAKCKMSKQFIFDRNTEEVKALRREKQRLFQQRSMANQSNLDFQKEKAQELREFKQNVIENRKNFFNRKKDDVLLDQMSLFESERLKQKRKEAIIQELEKIEQEHLEKFNITKLKNREAQQQLEQSKILHSKQYEEKFDVNYQPKKIEKTIQGHPASQFQNNTLFYVLEEDTKKGELVLKARN